ncbi:hypothetical protein [Salimicrobium halophilum]|uniref:Uncharacterized protein n=1 Tax=Salimicrobium halophilum TaxID=86666 RepID=A0A1G8WLJ4_9BACI|nr:hypothetical protein [Salimicrobium halophilum]SDJ79174.1 hypothetical protein SAMN04490247_3238 [Salimicrobium halophilum]
MSEQTWVLSQGKEKRTVQPERVAYYERVQIVEARLKKRMYYIFFYKETYVTAIQATKIKIHSFLARAFREGLVCSTPHPLLERLNKNKPFPTSTYSSFLQQLADNYTHQEQAYILTFLESFIPKKKLLQQMKTLFYEIRRQGKMFQAYKIIRVLMDFAPNHRFVKELSHDLNFQSFEEVYELPGVDLWDKDPLQAEKRLFHERDPELLPLLGSTQPLEYTGFSLLLLIEGTTTYEDYKETWKTLFREEERTLLLEHVNRAVPSEQKVKQELLSVYVAQKRLHEASELLKDNDMILTEEERQSVKNVLLTTPFFVTDVPMWERYLDEILAEDTAEKGQLLHAFVRDTLPYADLSEIRTTLTGFRGGEDIDIYDKVQRMEEWQEDLDHMEELGVLYYEFGQPEKALECFQYASEMMPESIQPVQWMAKVYKDLGYEEESQTYRNLTKQMQKTSL